MNFTAREHYIAHLLLAKIYDDAAMYAAIHLMGKKPKHTKQNAVKFNSHLYAKMRIAFGKKSSEKQKGKQAGKNNPMYGKSIFDFMTPEGIARWRKNSREGGMKGRRHSSDTRMKISTAMKGNSNTAGLHWFNDGARNVYAKECPEGFAAGRLIKNV